MGSSPDGAGDSNPDGVISGNEDDEHSDETNAGVNGDSASPERPTPGADESYCSSCGEIIKKEAEICPECGVRQRSSTAEKNPGIAAVASFFWGGLGQIYNGQIAKGIGLMLLQAINVLLMFVLIGFLTYFITWVYAIYDAYNTAEKINSGKISV
jgi:TM2 domain-containing membrane protein YozV